MGFPPAGRQTIRLTLLVALITAAVLAILSAAPHGARAALMDDETPGLAPPQYQDWDHAYNLTPADAGTVLQFRRDGGGDDDYFRFQGLEVGDLVTLTVDPATWMSEVDFYVSDPQRFPVWYYKYDGSTEPLPLVFEFFVASQGDYYFHTGQGYGDTFINISFSIEASGIVPDGNDRPDQASVLSGNETISSDLDQPYDPSDFYKVHLAPGSSRKVFLTIKVLDISAGAAKWELYSSEGVKRPSEGYASDTFFQDLPTMVEFAPILTEDDYYLRVWMRLGSGNVKLSFLMYTYPNDGNDDYDGATEVHNGDVIVDTVNTKMDPLDNYKIALVPHDNLSLWLEVDDDLDLFLFFEGGRQAASMEFDTVTEHIKYEVPEGATGWYYIIVQPYNLDPGVPSQTIHYTLRVRTNLDPVAYPAAAGLIGVHSLWEDTDDSTIDLALLFSDPEGGPLSYRVVGGFNSSLLDITLVGTRLRVSPAPNASGFEDMVTVEAVDDHGYWCDYTISLYVMPVDDPPQVGPPGASEPPGSIELDEDGTSEPYEPIRWFWDVDDPFWDLSISVLAESPIEVSLKGYVMTVRAVVADWWGSTKLRVVASDPDGLMATLVMSVHVRAVNDPPEARTASLLLSANASTIDIDLRSMFRDVDGDVLSYVVTTSGAPNVVRDGILTVTDLMSHQGTRVELEVTAVDPPGATTAPVRIAIWVPEMPGQPVLGMSPSEFTVVEGSELALLRLTVSDQDPLPRTYVIVVRAEGWEGRFGMEVSSTGVDWPDGPPAWTPGIRRQARDAEGTVTVIDGPFNATVGFLVHVVRLNHAPEVQRILFDHDGNYRAGDAAVAEATVVDADSDPLTYRWSLDGRAVPGEGARLRIEDLAAGMHHVLLNVTDGCATGENTASFYVRTSAAPTDSSTTVAIAVGLAASVAVAVALAIYVSRRRRGKGGA